MLQYGCWCQILKDRLAGKGVPTDKYDELCRDWQRCNEVFLNLGEVGPPKHIDTSRSLFIGFLIFSNFEKMCRIHKIGSSRTCVGGDIQPIIWLINQLNI